MDQAEVPALAQRCHRTLEPLHVLVYFAEEAKRAFVDAGLEPGRMCYFASRAAPLGRVGAGVVTATFHNFNPDLIARHIPRAWSLVDPGEVLKLRFAKAGEALRRLLGAEAADSPELAELNGLLQEIAEFCTPEGRPLYAAHADRDWPDDPVTGLWHGASLLREFRGDGHIGVLVSEGLTGLESLVTHTATGAGFRTETAKSLRAWSDEQWAAAEAALTDRGLLDTTGALTDAGWAQRNRIEERTIALAAEPYRRIGPEKSTRMAELGQRFTHRALEAGALPRDRFDQD